MVKHILKQSKRRCTLTNADGAGVGEAEQKESDSVGDLSHRGIAIRRCAKRHENPNATAHATLM